MKLSRWVIAALLIYGAGAQAQSVVNWPAAATAPPSQPANSDISLGAIQTDPVRVTQPAPLPPPLPQPISRDVPASLPDVSGLGGSYVDRSGAESNVRLDVGRVSPQLIARYQQQPGEGESTYVERMGSLYRASQAELIKVQTRNAAYIRSLAPPNATPGLKAQIAH